MRRRVRARQVGLLLLAVFVIAYVSFFKLPRGVELPLQQTKSAPDTPTPEQHNSPPNFPTTSHPIWSLMRKAEQEFDEVRSRQSKSLAEAVAEYRRRYGIHPPPNFDKWYQFAVDNDVQMIDEYDIIHKTLTPFWGIKPLTIRARAKEALGYDNNLLGILIREGKIKKIDGGREWMQEALKGMLAPSLPYLPSLDLAFNIHDEPRVIIQYDDLSRLVSTALQTTMPAAYAVTQPRNQFSYHPADLNDGSRFEESRRTRFNRMNYQQAWTHSRISCPPTSAARSLDESPLDDTASYALSRLGFIYNTTSFTNLCNSPSFKDSHGFFTAPNAFSLTQDLTPIFSQSKISSFQDIVYPSPWYWAGKVTYHEENDREWREKEDKLYWRGSTTGGYSRDGGWRNQHRQRFVGGINAADTAKIFKSSSLSEGMRASDPFSTAESGSGSAGKNWTVQEVFRPDYQDLFDVRFSDVGQCDPGDCRSQKEFFRAAGKAEFDDAYGYKYLIDMDGNAFSGRFYAFLRSRSLVYKLAIFREWHDEWLRPWLHFVPLSLRGEEWVEAVRWVAGTKEGREGGKGVAERSREWSGRVTRKVDMEAWFFRLLLEYARVVDDEREMIGFTL
jgi:hypothetical protein